MFKIAFYKGKGRIGDKLIKWWDNGPYSHCELVFSDGMWGTAYGQHGVVLWKRDGNPETWEFIELPAHLEARARKWFEDNCGKSYDYFGLARFVFDFLPASRDKFFCSHACAAALGMKEGWRNGPNGLAAAIENALVI
jgi:hypothetical protein